VRATYLVYIVLFYFIFITTFDKGYHSYSSSYAIFLALCHFLTLMSKYSLKYIECMFLSHDVIGQVSGPYETTGKLQLSIL
jgi:hypothetical protein